MSELSIVPLGSSAALISVGDAMSAENASRVHALMRQVSDAKLDGVIDVAPAYSTLAIYFDPAQTSYEEVAATARSLDAASSDVDATSSSALVEIPVHYDGMDLVEVAQRCGFTVEEVIRRHSSVTYDVYMLGFVPGFAYLGVLDASLVLSRRSEPRTRVPSGSVAIAGAQTGIYPRSTPGGWHIIGTTKLAMFDVARSRPSLLAAGDRVRFVPVGA
jgi:inhibitor of KinA